MQLFIIKVMMDEKGYRKPRTLMSNGAGIGACNTCAAIPEFIHGIGVSVFS